MEALSLDTRRYGFYGIANFFFRNGGPGRQKSPDLDGRGLKYAFREGLFTYHFKVDLGNIAITEVDRSFVSA